MRCAILGVLVAAAWTAGGCGEEPGAAKPAEVYDALAARIDELAPELIALSRSFYETPEIGHREFETVRALASFLGERGFATTVGLPELDLPTALIATRFVGDGGSAVAFGPMLDALPGPDGAAFHGCHHNLQGPAAVGAAVALAEALASNGIGGRVSVISYPAEEVPPPAVERMFRAGVYRDVDFLLEFHGAPRTKRPEAGIGGCCGAPSRIVRYTFRGRPVAAGLGRPAPQSNALDALLLLHRKVDALKQRIAPNSVVRSVIRSGGEAPNVVPRKTVAEFDLRTPGDPARLEELAGRVDAAARTAARETATDVDIEVLGEYGLGISLGVLHDRAFRLAQRFGADGREDRRDPPEGWHLSQWMPGVGVQVRTYHRRTPIHTQEMAEASVLPLAQRGMLTAASTLAALGYDLVSSVELRARAREEHAHWREELARRGWLRELPQGPTAE